MITKNKAVEGKSWQISGPIHDTMPLLSCFQLLTIYTLPADSKSYLEECMQLCKVCRLMWAAHCSLMAFKLINHGSLSQDRQDKRAADKKADMIKWTGYKADYANGQQTKRQPTGPCCYCKAIRPIRPKQMLST